MTLEIAAGVSPRPRRRRRALPKRGSASRRPRPSPGRSVSTGVFDFGFDASTPSIPERDPEAEVLHDLRSPLSVIRVYTDLIQEAARRGELPNREYLDNLGREIELAERLVGTPLAPTEATPWPDELPAPQNADLVEILGSLATAYRLAHGGRIRIEFIAERPQLPVAADPVALQRAFRNVLDNAIKYTPDGGEVRIRAGAAGTQAFVVVKDTGMGMSPEESARAFDYRLPRAGAPSPRAGAARGSGSPSRRRSWRPTAARSASRARPVTAPR